MSDEVVYFLLLDQNTVKDKKIKNEMAFGRIHLFLTEQFQPMQILVRP